MPRVMTRRDALRTASLGFGALALASLLRDEARADTHFAPKAKSVVLLFQSGGPGQMDLFDPKPELQKRDGQKAPVAVDKFLPGNSDLLVACPFKFRKYGTCGTEMSELLPHMGALADELCVVRSMHTGHDNHTEGTIMLNTGHFKVGRPAIGAWACYGLGTANKNLPAYVVLRDPAGYDTAGSLAWAPGWLSPAHGGTEFSSRGVPVANLKPPVGVSPEARRDDLDLLAALNEGHRKAFPKELELEARIRNYELAARMQAAAGDALDLSRETLKTRTMYGLDDPATASYGTRCLMARRLVEAGVRFVHVYPDQQGQVWDTHNNMKVETVKMCRQTDGPSAALIKDLKARGLLENTIVVWAGEFGRLPVAQNGIGRDHNKHAFSLLLSGGGFKGGSTYGETDEFGYKAAVDRVSVPDLHATLLHQLGLDHTKLTADHDGRAETPTDAVVTGAKVIDGLLARPARR